MSAQERLLKDSPTLEKLYDAECVLEIEPAIARGFIVLLGGASERRSSSSSGGKATGANNNNNNNNNNNEADLNLAFLAITQGNVVDACFGVPISGSRKDNSPASAKAKTGKELIDDAAISSDPVRQIAVNKYREAFREAIACENKIRNLNCFVRCFRYKKLRGKSEKKLHDIFSELAKAIDETKGTTTSS
jgi:hypothetical protein